MQPQTRPRLTALILACAMFMAQLDASVVLVALPQMAHSFGSRPVDLSIGITVYLLAQAVLLPASSWVAERCGARDVFAFALAGFTLASVLCGLSHSLPQFIAARVLQGCTAALMLPIARIVLLEATEKEDLVGVMTLSTVPMLIAPTLGPPVGGIIVTYLTWPWIFFLNVPVGMAGIALVLRFIARTPVQSRRPFDLRGFLLIGAASGAVLFGLDQLSTSSASWAAGTALTLAGLACGVLALGHLRRHPHPVLSLSAAGIRTYAVTTLGAGLAVRLPLRALPFVLPLLFQVVFGFSALYAGLLLLAMNGGDLVLKSLASWSLRRFGFRGVLVSSASLVVLAVAACALFSSRSTYWLIFALLGIAGMARSLLLTGLSTLAFADVPRAELASSSVLWNLMMQLSNALGVSLAAILMNVTSLALGTPLGHVTRANSELTLLAMAVIGAAAIPSFVRLPHDAGALLSGHRPVRSAARG